MSSEMRELVEDWRKGRLSGYVGLTKTERAVLRVAASELELRLARTEAGAVSCTFAHGGDWPCSVCGTPRKDAAPVADGHIAEVCIHDGHKYLKWTDGDYHYMSVGTRFYTRPHDASARWLPIETAPKDGRRVLAFAGARPFIARHGRTVGWWDDNDLMRDPTHWRPLPDSPASQDQDGGKA